MLNTVTNPVKAIEYFGPFDPLSHLVGGEVFVRGILKFSKIVIKFVVGFDLLYDLGEIQGWRAYQNSLKVNESKAIFGSDDIGGVCIPMKDDLG